MFVGYTFSPAEDPVRLLAFIAVITAEYAVYLRLDVDPMEAAVERDPVFEGVIRAAPAVAWENRHSEIVPVGVQLGVCVPDARPNEVLEVRVMCSQEKSGYALQERPVQALHASGSW